MNKEYEMTQEELDDMIAISQDKTPVMKFGDYWSGLDKQERANEFWKKLGDKYQFVWDTVGPGDGSDIKKFMAKPTEDGK